MNRQVCFLLLGPERGEKDEFIANLKKRSKAWETAETYRYYAFEKSMSELVSEMKNHDLFNPLKIVICNNTELVKQKADCDMLSEYIKNPSPDVLLILLSEEISVSERIQKVMPKDNIKIFWELTEAKKISWINDYFSKKKCSIEREAVNFLLEMVENNTMDLQREADRLMGFFNDCTTFSLEQIEEYVQHSKEESVFSLFAALASGKPDSVMDILNRIRLSREDNAVSLIAGLIWQFRQLMGIQRLIGQNYHVEEALSKTNIRSKKQQSIYRAGVSKFSLEELERIFPLLIKADRDVRVAKSEIQDLLLELLMYSISTKSFFSFQKET